MFGDLEKPLNASRGLSTTAGFLVALNTLILIIIVYYAIRKPNKTRNMHKLVLKTQIKKEKETYTKSCAVRQ